MRGREANSPIASTRRGAQWANRNRRPVRLFGTKRPAAVGDSPEALDRPSPPARAVRGAAGRARLQQHRPGDAQPRPARLCRGARRSRQARDPAQHRQAALRRYAESAHRQPARRGLYAGGQGRRAFGLLSEHVESVGRSRLRGRRHVQRSPDGDLHADPGRRFRAADADANSAERAVRHARDPGTGGADAWARRAVDQRPAQLGGGRSAWRDARGVGVRRGARSCWRICATTASWASASRPRATIASPICCSTGRSSGPRGPGPHACSTCSGSTQASRSFPIRFGFGGGRPDEIRIYTRSLLEILGNLAAQIEVPARDVAAGRTYPTETSRPSCRRCPTWRSTHLAIEPIDAFVAVEYRGTWFWIDDNDYRAKRVFSVLLLLLNLVDKSGAPCSCR